jgi:hypothetical protein
MTETVFFRMPSMGRRNSPVRNPPFLSADQQVFLYESCHGTCRSLRPGELAAALLSAGIPLQADMFFGLRFDFQYRKEGARRFHRASTRQQYLRMKSGQARRGAGTWIEGHF